MTIATRTFRIAAALIVALFSLGCVTATKRQPPSASGRSTPGVSPAPNTLDSRQALAELNAERNRFWLDARRQVDRSVPELIVQHQAELQRGLHYCKLLRGDPDTREIALTFDDGPHPGYTPELLEILRRSHVKAAFFLVGEMAERCPDLVRAEASAGHSIGNHTYHHVSLLKIPTEDVAIEIKSCGEALRSITGAAPRWFRPPGGDYDSHVAEVAEALGYTIVLWTDDPGDYASPGRDVVQLRALEAASNGGILLLHDGIAQTVAALPQIIESLRNQGYRFVTIDEMMATRQRTAWVRRRL